MRTHSPAVAPLLLAATLAASFGVGSDVVHAQCDPVWETAIGAPGVGDGYAGPMAVWNSGSGDALYVGGSFSAIGGQTRRGIGRWNSATNTWTSLAQGCFSTNTNYFVAAISTFDPDGGGPLPASLIAGGGFGTASNVANTANLARWNGAAWSSLGTPPNGAVWTLAEFNGRLYVGGGYTSIGCISANGIASLSGTTSSPLTVGMGGGFAPGVFALKVFDDGSGEKLYVGGRFASIGGYNGLIARWNGKSWEEVGSGVGGAAQFFGIESMTIFDADGPGGAPAALYVGGADLRPQSGPPTNPVNVLKWDGAGWLPVGQNIGGRTTALASFDDGNGPALYATGTAQPGISYFAKLVNNVWVPAFGGVGGAGIPPSNFPSAFGLLAWDDRLVVAGNFTQAGTAAARGLAIVRGCESCRADFNSDGFADSQDLFDFLAAFFDLAPPGDFNDDSFINSQDLFDFLGAFFAGCP